MSKSNILHDLLGIQGWRVARDGIRIEEDGAVVVRAEPEPGSRRSCSQCGEGSLVDYDHLPPRRIRDFPVWGWPSFVEVSAARVGGRHCKTAVIERLDWLEPYVHRTFRYERCVAALCGLMPALDVAELEGIDRNAIHEIDRERLERREALRPARCALGPEFSTVPQPRILLRVRKKKRRKETRSRGLPETESAKDS